MLRFQHISHLFALGIIPVLLVLFLWMVYWRKNKLAKIGDQRLINEQVRGFIPGRSTLRFILVAIGLSAIIIGWANLQLGSGMENMERKGVDVIIALDVSKSMLATDIQPDRLTRAKQLVMRMIDKMKNDRVALVVFAGRAYLQVPLTIDYGAMKMMLQNVKPSLVPTQGTVISEAIDLAKQSFSQKEKKYKSLIIISDGEDHDEHAGAKIKEATEAGIIVHTVGIGSPQGATLYDSETRAVKLDENGNPVISKLNEEELRLLAAAGHGTYTLLRNTDDAADKLIDEIDGMEQRSLGVMAFREYKSYFQWFLLGGLILLLIEWLLPGANIKLKTKTT
jgi:Ca-activated chloride channel family protein